MTAGSSSFDHLLADGLLDSNMPALIHGILSGPVRARSCISALTPGQLHNNVKYVPRILPLLY